MTNSINDNLNSYYSNDMKVKRTGHAIVSAPETLPSYHLFNDADARSRIKIINNDIYEETKKEKSKTGTNFCKAFAAAVLFIAGFLGIKKLFK